MKMRRSCLIERRTGTDLTHMRLTYEINIVRYMAFLLRLLMMNRTIFIWVLLYQVAVATAGTRMGKETTALERESKRTGDKPSTRWSVLMIINRANFN